MRDLHAPATNTVAPDQPCPQGLAGRYARLERLTPDHAPALHAAHGGVTETWAWLPYGPFASAADLAEWIVQAVTGTDQAFYAITDLASGQVCGVASYLRIAPAAPSIEIGHLCFAPPLQRTRAATEALLLMIRWAFETGYRRVEWKCNALNAPSRAAATRLGFGYEGTHRQAAIVKGHNRDTAWFSALDGDWPDLAAAYEAWLDPGNFDAAGRQRRALRDLTAALVGQLDPGAKGA